MIEVVVAPPYLAVQDFGRTGFRSQGVPVGGAMDRWALGAANTLVGNPPEAAAFEWALGAGTMRVHRPMAVALTGREVAATLDDAPMAGNTTYRAQAGSVLVLSRVVAGRFAYLAVEGGVDVPIVLGSRSTYLPARFGGFEGRLLRSGDRLMTGAPVATAPRSGFSVPPDLLPDYGAPTCRILPGPHGVGLFGAPAWQRFLTEPFRVERTSDRTGYRLAGPPLADGPLGTLPSEPMCAGAVQVATGGQAIVLMADGPTVGGYPVIAVVSSTDLSILAQRQPGEEVRFEQVSVQEAQRSMQRLETAGQVLRRLAAAA
jgi:antagonist of KipI